MEKKDQEEYRKLGTCGTPSLGGTYKEAGGEGGGARGRSEPAPRAAEHLFIHLKD